MTKQWGRWVISIFSLWVIAVQGAAAEPSVTIATLVAPPFSGDNLENNGYGPQIVVQAFARAGYAATVVIYPWSRGLEMCKKGMVDGIMPLWRTPEREAVFDFSIPIPLPYIMGIYKKKSISFKGGLDLKPYIVGYVFGYRYPDKFREVTAGVRTEPSYTAVEMMEKLILGRIDIAVVGRRQGEFFLKTRWPERKGEFRFLHPPIDTVQRYLGFSKADGDYRGIIQAFNRGLEMIKADGTVDRILKKHGIRPN